MASWLAATVNAAQEVQDLVIEEGFDGAMLEHTAMEGDRDSFVELGITRRLQQTKIFTQWASIPN